MNDNYYNGYEDEMEIDLIDLMFDLMRHWRSLIVAIIIGAIVGGGIYVVKKTSAEKAAVQEDDQEASKLPEDYEVNPDVEANMELAYQYWQLYFRQLEYNQKSIVMQLNPNAVYSGELKYYVSAGYDTGLISILYQNILSDSNVLAELQEASQLDCEPSYIKELIGCSISSESDASVNINNMMSSSEESAAFVTKNAAVTYSVVSTSEESCEQMLEIIRKKVAELDAECAQGGYETYRALEVNDAVRLVTNNDYLNRQKANIDQLSTYLSNVQRLEATFEEDDLIYYNETYLAREYEMEEESSELLGTAGAEEGPVSVNPVKWLVIGIFLLCVCWGGYFMLKYLLDKHIKTSDEVKNYRIPLIGCLEGQKKQYKGLDALIEKLARRTKSPADSEDYIAASIEAMDAKEILLCGDLKDEATRKVMNSLKEKCARIEISEYPGQNSEALERAGERALVFLVQIGKTTRTELQRELEVCRMQKIGVLGAVVM